MSGIKAFQARIDSERAQRKRLRPYTCLLLVLLQSLNICAAIFGGVSIEQPLCETNAGVTLPAWLLTSGIINTVCDIAFALLVYFHYHNPCKSKNAAGTVPLNGFCYSLCVGIPVGFFLIVAFLFQISWFVVGTVALSSTAQQCTKIVYGFSIAEIVTMPISMFCVKVFVWKTFES